MTKKFKAKAVDPETPILVGQKEWNSEDDGDCEKFHQSKYWETLQRVCQRMCDEENEEILNLDGLDTALPLAQKLYAIRTIGKLLVFISHAGKRIEAKKS